jgi:hypothetical protein
LPNLNDKGHEKAQITANRSAFVETNDEVIFDKAIINTYRQLTKVTVLNKSHFALRNIQGSPRRGSPVGARRQ